MSILKDILQSSYQPRREAKNTLEKSKLKLDSSLSDRQSKVFLDEDGKPNIVFRGSKTARDFLVSDPLLALGLSRFDKRTHETNRKIRDVKNKYQQDPNLYGHSLGGKLAESGGEHTTGNITTFNKGAGIGDIFKKVPSNQTDIRTSGDLVSALSIGQRGGKKITLNQPNILKAHGLKQLKRLKNV